MPDWPFPPGVFGQHLDLQHARSPHGASPRRRAAARQAPRRTQELWQRRRLEHSVREEWAAPVELEPPEPEEVKKDAVQPGAESPKAEAQEEEEEPEQTNELDWRRDPDKPLMKMSMTQNVSARTRWQVAFAKVREMTQVARKRQHRVALGLKVKEYLTFHHLRGACGKMERAVDSFERSLFSNQEVAYDVFGETVIPEADQWVKKNFEEMRESLEPVVQNEQSRKYDMNELERMIRMKEQEDQWSDAQQRSTEELLHTHGRLTHRSVTSLEEMVRQVRQVFAALAAEIAEGLQRHCSLRQEHDTAETQFFEMSQKQKRMMTQIEEFEARKKEATDGYNRELDMLQQEYTKVRRATASVKFQLAKDRHYCERVAQQLQDQMAAQMSRTVEVMAEEHIKRIQRKWDVRQREKIMRHATDEKELQEMREQLRKRELHLQEQKAFLEVSLSRSRAIKAKLLLFELQARTQELENAKPAQRKSIRRMWTRGLEGALPAPGLLPLLSQELQIQRQWLIERGQHLELNPSNLEVEGRPLLATPSALICKLWEFFLDLKEPSKRLTRVFRSELSETTAQNRRTEVVQLSGTLFDSQEVQKQVEQALNSLEATRRAHETLAERWALGSSDAEVHVTLSEKLEELDQGLDVAEACTRWWREPDQNTAQHLASLTSKEELSWLRGMAQSLGVRCGQLRAGCSILEAAQPEGSQSRMDAVASMLSSMPALVNEEMLTGGEALALRMQRLLSKRQMWQGQMAETWSRQMTAQQEESMESFAEGVGSLLHLLEDEQLKQTPQDELRPAEILTALHCTAARVFKRPKNQVFDWAMIGLDDMDHMVFDALVAEQAARTSQKEVAEVDANNLLNAQHEFSIQIGNADDLLQSMVELKAAMEVNEALLKHAEHQQVESTEQQNEDENKLLEDALMPTAGQADARDGAPLDTLVSDALPSLPAPSALVSSEAHSTELQVDHQLDQQCLGDPTSPETAAGPEQASDDLPSDAARSTAAEHAPPRAATAEEAEHPAERSAEEDAEVQVPLPPTEKEAQQESQLEEPGADSLPQAHAHPFAEVASHEHGQEPQPREKEQELVSEAPGSPKISATPAEAGEAELVPDGKPNQQLSDGQEADLQTPSSPKNQTPEAEAVEPGASTQQEVERVERNQPQQAEQPDQRNQPDQQDPQDPQDTATSSLLPKTPGHETAAREEAPLQDVPSTEHALRADHQHLLEPDPALPTTPAQASAEVTHRDAEQPEQPERPEQPEQPEQVVLTPPAPPKEGMEARLATSDTDAREQTLEQSMEPSQLEPGTESPASSPSRERSAEAAEATEASVADLGEEMETTQGEHPQQVASAAEASSRVVASPTSPKTPHSAALEAALREIQLKKEGIVGTEGTEGPADATSDAARSLSPPSPKVTSRPQAGSPKTEAGAGETEDEESEAAAGLAALVSANFSRRVAAGSAAQDAISMEELPGDEASLPQAGLQHQHTRAQLGILATTSPGASPKGKAGRRRRPRAMTRLGTQKGEDDAERTGEEEYEDVEDSPLDVEDSQEEGGRLRPRMSQVTAAALLSKVKEQGSSDVVHPEVLKLQKRLKEELEQELRAEEEDAQVSREELEAKVSFLQVHLEAQGLLKPKDADNLYLMALAEMSGDSVAAGEFARRALSEKPSESSESSWSPRHAKEMLSPSMRLRAQQLVESMEKEKAEVDRRLPVKPRGILKADRSQSSDQVSLPSDAEVPSENRNWRGKILARSASGLRKMNTTPELEPPEPWQVDEQTPSQVSAAQISKVVRKAEPWARPTVATEDPAEITLEGLATGPRGARRQDSSEPGDLREHREAPVLPDVRARRRSSLDAAELDSLVAVGRNTLKEDDAEAEEAEEERLRSPTWVDDWIHSAQETLLTVQEPAVDALRPGGAAGAGGGAWLRVGSGISGSKEQPMVAMIALQADGAGSKGSSRRMRGSKPISSQKRREKGSPRMVGFEPVPAVRRRDSDAVERKEPLSQDASVAAAEAEAAEAAALSSAAEVLPELSQEAVVMPVPEEPAEPEEPEVQVDELLDPERRPSSAVNSEVTSEDEETMRRRREEQRPQGEQEDGTSSSGVRRTPSKTALGKSYQRSKGSKMDLLLRSRSFLSSNSLMLDEDEEPGDSGEEMKVVEATKELAVKRWKLGGLAVQAVLRLRGALNSPQPGSRRTSLSSRLEEGPPEPPQPSRRESRESMEPRTLVESRRTSHEAPPLQATGLLGLGPALPATGPERKAGVAKLPQLDQADAREQESHPPSGKLKMPPVPMRLEVPEAGKMKVEASRNESKSKVPEAPRSARTPRLPDAKVKAEGGGTSSGAATARAPATARAAPNSVTLTAATIQALRSLDAPYLSSYGKSEQRLLSAHTTATTFLSKDDSRTTLKEDSSVGFSPYASQTELHQASTMSYQSSVAKLSSYSAESEKHHSTEEPHPQHRHAQHPHPHVPAQPHGPHAVLPTVERIAYGVETALLNPKGKLIGSPGCWTSGLSKEVGEVYVTTPGPVLEIRKSRMKGHKLVASNFVKPKRRLVEVSAMPGSAQGGLRRVPLHSSLRGSQLHH